MQNVRMDESQAGIDTTGRKNNLSFADDTTWMAENEEELRSCLMWVKEESEKAGLRLNIHKTMIMASSLITAWQIKGEKMETLNNFIFLGSTSLWMVTAAMELKATCCLEEKVSWT